MLQFMEVQRVKYDLMTEQENLGPIGTLFSRDAHFTSPKLAWQYCLLEVFDFKYLFLHFYFGKKI